MFGRPFYQLGATEQVRLMLFDQIRQAEEAKERAEVVGVLIKALVGRR